MFKRRKPHDEELKEIEKELKDIQESQKRAEESLRDIAGILRKLAEESKKVSSPRIFYRPPYSIKLYLEVRNHVYEQTGSQGQSGC